MPTGARSFDAFGDYLTRYPGTPSAQVGTYTAWVYAHGSHPDGYGCLFKLESANDNTLLVHQTTLKVFTDVTGWHDSGVSMSTGAWHHVALVVRSTSDTEIWLDGTRVLDAVAIPDPGSGGYCRIGGVAGGDYRFNGIIGAVKAWNVALADADLINERRRLRPSHQLGNLHFWLPWSDAKDRSGQGRDFTVMGSPAEVAGPPVPWGGVGLVVQGLPMQTVTPARLIFRNAQYV